MRGFPGGFAGKPGRKGGGRPEWGPAPSGGFAVAGGIPGVTCGAARCTAATAGGRWRRKGIAEPRLSAIENRKRGVGKVTAMRLGKAFGMDDRGRGLLEKPRDRGFFLPFIHHTKLYLIIQVEKVGLL